MRFEFDKTHWPTLEDGEKDCFLLTNGLGGYCSLSLIGAAARGDHALFMEARRAPNVRWHMITNMLEKLTIEDQTYILSSQRMKSDNPYMGFLYLNKFVYDDLDPYAPFWEFEVEDIQIKKSIVMVHEENTVALQYEIVNPNKRSVSLEITPLIRFTSKKEDSNTVLDTQQIQIESLPAPFTHSAQPTFYKIADDTNHVYITTNAALSKQSPHLFGEMYFSQDERDGRNAYGNALVNHCLSYNSTIKDEPDTKDTLYIIISTKPYPYTKDIYNQLAQNELSRRKELLQQCKVQTELGRQLVLSSDAYIVNRDSTNGKSIIAGYPFFEDWGRDTMISLAGTTMVTGRFAECKSILKTFAKYVKNGLLPNLFPEGGENPMYNSADAPLLFVNSVYEYMEYSGDYAFKDEILPVLKQIISSYQNGTDFHIKMDTDGLIMAGEDLEQLTWMDVRVGDFLPTPRHGKPVEINAYWYSALMIMEKLTGDSSYKTLADKVQHSFCEKFWNENEQCLKDVLCSDGTRAEYQIRCNQIWALTMPFTMLPATKEALVIKKVKEELYTTVGLRTLSTKDPDFHEIYIGVVQERDRAYHQGTVWAFPLGAYYRACVKYANACDAETERAQMLKEVQTGLEALKPWLREGCVSQLAEIYDGKTPTISRGCFAQAWSVGELLRAVYDYETLLGQQ